MRHTIRKKTILICCSMAILLLTISFLGTGTAWSAPGKDKQILKNPLIKVSWERKTQRQERRERNQ
jgi:hypothetical protein